MPTQLKRWTHRKKIWDAEAAAKNIGKPYQFINLGNVLLEAGLTERALDAYQQALKQDSKSINALWGMAAISLSQKAYDQAKIHLKPIMDRDPDHKFGEASLAYGESLYQLQEWPAAKKHLIDDVRRWSHPEAVVMLATIQIQDGEMEAAKDGLEKMMFKLKGTPHFYFRKKRHLLGEAQRLLRQMK
ncbi:MAG: tetratricopeptide repeat protein [Merismopedia sp. SIO2A8]|nr:tetratricopeptide repeat protein [Merismopedia sp. SIO2A8]